MELLPKDIRGWMRRIQKDVNQLQRHRHPAADARVGELEGRVDTLESQVTALNQQVSILDQRVDELARSTAWTQLGASILPPGGWENFTVYREIGEWVTIRAWLRWGSATPAGGSQIVIDTLPTSLRPTERVWAMMYSTDPGEVPRMMEVNTNGLVFVLGDSASDTGQGYSLIATELSYPLGG